MRSLVWVILALFVCMLPARAQTGPAGRCIDQMRGQSFSVMPNGYTFQENFPANAGMSVRDPSGLNFLRMPAQNPFQQAFFVTWNGQLIEVNPLGFSRIGQCSFVPGYLPANPTPIFSPPVMAPNWTITTPAGRVGVPQSIADLSQPFVRPLIASEGSAKRCMARSGGDRDEFGDCMVNSMLGPREKAVYQCSKSSTSKADLAFCAVGALGGDNERRAASQLQQCYQQYGENWNQYALCMAGQNVGGEGGKLLSCVQQQSNSGSVSMLGTAVCYGAQSLHLNPEQQIALECAANSGGNPYAFAGCTGGRLTARELNKCFTDGIGGDDGCFGKNNEIVKELNRVNNALQVQFSNQNPAVQAFNNGIRDIQNGPGPGNTGVQIITNAANDVTRGMGDNNDIKKAIRNVFPHF